MASSSTTSKKKQQGHEERAATASPPHPATGSHHKGYIPRLYRQQVDVEQERVVLENVVRREEALAALDREYQRYRLRKPWSHVEALKALHKLRYASLDVVDQIRRWRQSLVTPEPFLVQDHNYLLKMTSDTDFLKVMADFQREFGLEIGKKNPFCLPIRNSWPGGTNSKGPKHKAKVVIEGGHGQDADNLTQCHGDSTDNNSTSTSRRNSGKDRKEEEEEQDASRLAALVHRIEQSVANARRSSSRPPSRPSTSHVQTHNAPSSAPNNGEGSRPTTRDGHAPRSPKRPSTSSSTARASLMTMEEYEIIRVGVCLSEVTEEEKDRISLNNKFLMEEQVRYKEKSFGKWGLQRWEHKPYRPPGFAYDIVRMGPPIPVHTTSCPPPPGKQAGEGDQENQGPGGCPPDAMSEPLANIEAARSENPPLPPLMVKRFKAVPTTEEIRYHLGMADISVATLPVRKDKKEKRLKVLEESVLSSKYHKRYRKKPHHRAYQPASMAREPVYLTSQQVDAAKVVLPTKRPNHVTPAAATTSATTTTTTPAQPIETSAATKATSAPPPPIQQIAAASQGDETADGPSATTSRGSARQTRTPSIVSAGSRPETTSSTSHSSRRINLVVQTTAHEEAPSVSSFTEAMPQAMNSPSQSLGSEISWADTLGGLPPFDPTINVLQPPSPVRPEGQRKCPS